MTGGAAWSRLTAKLFLEQGRICGQVQRTAGELDGLNESGVVKKNIDMPNLPDIHILMVSAFLELFHRRNDQRFRVFNLLHDKADIHGRELRLPLAPAVDSVLADQGERIRQNIERRGESAAHRAHLKFVALFGFTIVVEQVIPVFALRI